jgi:HlyD family secretion protein
VSLPDRTSPKTVELKLPVLDQRHVLGARLVQRAASVMLLIFAITIVVAIATSSLISVRVTVDGTGTLEPVLVSPVRSADDGRVKQILVKSGDTVRAGQVLMLLDSLDLATSLATLQAQYHEQEVARAQLVAAQPEDVRRQTEQRVHADAHLVRARATLLQRMVEYGLGESIDSLLDRYVPGTHVGIDLAISDVRDAQAEQRTADSELRRLADAPLALEAQDAKLAELRVTIAAARARLGRLAIRAPAAGIVLTDQLDRIVGSAVRSGDQLLEIGDPRTWQASVLISEADVHDVHPGDSVTVDVPALAALKVPRLPGSVLAVASSPAAIGQSAGAGVPTVPGAYHVIIALDQTQLRDIGIGYFRRGYSVTGKVVTRRGKIIQLLFARATQGLRQPIIDAR